MNIRRFITFVLTLFIGLAACAPARADESTGTLRRDKHVSRAVEQALVVRTARGGQRFQSGQRQSGGKVWCAGSHRGVPPAPQSSHKQPVRSVETLPGHWGAGHLTI